MKIIIAKLTKKFNAYTFDWIKTPITASHVD